MDNIAEKIAYMVSKRGGRAYYVGGFVRDKILGIAANDTDGKDVDELDVTCRGEGGFGHTGKQ